METIVRDHGGSGRTYKSAVLFAVPDAGDAIRTAVRDALAWEAIEDDEDTKKGLDEGCAAACFNGAWTPRSERGRSDLPRLSARVPVG